MPQLDPTSFASQLFWLTISFILLYVLLARVLLPRVQSVLVMRADTVESDIRQAEQMKSEAERASEAYERSLADARTKSRDMFVEVQAQGAARTAKLQAELDATIDKKLAEAEKAISMARTAVTDKLTPVAAELASLIVETLVKQKPSPKDVENVIGSSRKGAM